MTPYITPEGKRILQDELKALWQRRAEVTKALAAAAAEGDRSENAEYIYRKKELRGIDRRIRYLQKRLPQLKVVHTRPDDPDRVFFGARVTLSDPEDRVHTWRIVGPDEHDHARDYISIDAPLARALLKRAIGEAVTVHTPGGETHYVILDVRYDG